MRDLTGKGRRWWVDGEALRAGTRRAAWARVIGVRTRRRLRRWLGWVFVAVGVIGLADPDLPGAVPLLIGVALLQQGSGHIRRLLRRVDGWWRAARRRVLDGAVSLAPFTTLLSLGEERLGQASVMLPGC